MKIVITGGTGFIGRKLCKILTERGDHITVLSRNPKKAKQLLGLDSIYPWEPTTELPPKEAFKGAEVIIHLLGERVGQRWTPSIKESIRNSRVLGTRNLVKSIHELDIKPRTLISGSGIGFYGHCGEKELTEDSPRGDDFLAQLTTEWENEAQQAAKSGVRVVLLRTGIVLGKDGGALKQMLLPFKVGLGGPLGNGKQWFSWIHRNDLIGLIIHAMTHEEISGPLNGTSPHPVRNKEFTQTLGKVLHRPSFLPTPLFAMRMLFGEFVDLGLLGSQKVLPQKALETNYQFKFPMCREALKNILK